MTTGLQFRAEGNQHTTFKWTQYLQLPMPQVVWYVGCPTCSAYKYILTSATIIDGKHVASMHHQCNDTSHRQVSAHSFLYCTTTTSLASHHTPFSRTLLCSGVPCHKQSRLHRWCVLDSKNQKANQHISVFQILHLRQRDTVKPRCSIHCGQHNCTSENGSGGNARPQCMLKLRHILVDMSVFWDRIPISSLSLCGGGDRSPTCFDIGFSSSVTDLACATNLLGSTLIFSVGR